VTKMLKPTQIYAPASILRCDVWLLVQMLIPSYVLGLLEMSSITCAIVCSMALVPTVVLVTLKDSPVELRSTYVVNQTIATMEKTTVTSVLQGNNLD